MGAFRRKGNFEIVFCCIDTSGAANVLMVHLLEGTDICFTQVEWFRGENNTFVVCSYILAKLSKLLDVFEDILEN